MTEVAVPQFELNGVQKAAVLLMQMDRERSAAVLRELRETEVADIMAEVTQLQRVEVEAVHEVLTEFHHLATARAHVANGGIGVARELLMASRRIARCSRNLISIAIRMIMAIRSGLISR